MWTFEVVVLALVAVQFFISTRRERSMDLLKKIKLSFCLWVFGLFIGGIFAYWTATLTSGLKPDYSTGVREGYIVKLSEKGVIFRTWEAQLQLGSGEQASLQNAWEFSIPRKDAELYAAAQAALGKRVRISYREWLIQPYSCGNSDYDALTLEVLPQK